MCIDAPTCTGTSRNDFARDGAPSRRTSAWTGRWWSLWGAVDLVPLGSKVLSAAPALFNPFMDAPEITPGKRSRGVSTGKITLAGGFASHGETARLLHDGRGRVTEVRLAGARLLPEARVRAELLKKYG